MKRFIWASVAAEILLAAMTPVVMAQMGATRAAGADPNLVGWWKLDDDRGNIALDSSGYGNHGTVEGGAQWVKGYVGGALSFDGIDDGINCGSDPRLMQVDSVSVAAWVKLDALGGDRKVAGTHDGVLGGYKLGVYYDNRPEFEIRAVGNISVLNRDLPGGTTLQRDVWYHLTGVYERGSYIRTYVNGRMDRDLETAAVLGISNGPLYIGRELCCGVLRWQGVLDDVRIYNKVLAEGEIGRIMQGDPQMAWGPWPEPGATVDFRSVSTLSWFAGDGAVQHDVYLGLEEGAVEAADTTSPLYWGRQTDTSFSLAGRLEFGRRYFWRIDEVEADGVTIHQGSVWKFTVSGQILVDDFESYTDNVGRRIDDTWVDGSLNGTGAQVGNLLPPFAERTIVHDGAQSMPFSYNNAWSPYYSEAVREFPWVQDWTVGGARTLSLWVRGDVPSFAETSPGAFTISAQGDDIWNLNDQFRYVFQRLDGDGSIEARVDSIVNTDVWAKAGVMIRETLEPSSRHAFMCITPDGRRAFQNRPSANSGVCLTAHCSPGRIKLPFWVKLQRRGNLFTAYYSSDGATWVQQPVNEEITTYQTTNPATISMAASAYVGLALTSHNAGAVTTATFSHVAVAGDVIGPWQGASIGAEQPGNSPDDLYVALEDSAGHAAIVTNPDPLAVNALRWTEWRIPLSSFTDVNLAQVKRMGIGVGARETSTADGMGRIYVDDIAVSGKSAISTFGIYLVNTGDLLLSDEDMAAYVRATHKIELNASGIDKWNSYIAYDDSFDPPIPVLTGGLYQKEFVVRIDDKDYYKGKFWSIVSSQSYPGVVILDAVMPCTSDHNTIRIEYGYPWPVGPSKDDPRNNEEIFDFFAKRGKLK